MEHGKQLGAVAQLPAPSVNQGSAQADRARSRDCCARKSMLRCGSGNTLAGRRLPQTTANPESYTGTWACARSPALSSASTVGPAGGRFDSIWDCIFLDYHSRRGGASKLHTKRTGLVFHPSVHLLRLCEMVRIAPYRHHQRALPSRSEAQARAPRASPYRHYRALSPADRLGLRNRAASGPRLFCTDSTGVSIWFAIGGFYAG